MTKNALFLSHSFCPGRGGSSQPRHPTVAWALKTKLSSTRYSNFVIKHAGVEGGGLFTFSRYVVLKTYVSNRITQGAIFDLCLLH